MNNMNRTAIIGSAAATLVAGCCFADELRTVVKPRVTDEVLVNPDMGFVHYQYSNRLWAYGAGLEPSDTLDGTLPGTSVAYMRVLWRDVEPREGEYRWDVFDSVAQNWIRAGKKIAIRIICSNQTTNACPDFVREAGAKGVYYRYNLAEDRAAYDKLDSASVKFWEPVFDDPVFLAKLDAFLKVFAERYDGNPSVAFVDVGSLGLYGEGHTWGSSFLDEATTLRLAKVHMDLWRKRLPNTYLVISDDVAGGWNTDPDHPAMAYARKLGIGFRDDSIMCAKEGDAGGRAHPWFHDGWARMFALTSPVVLETGHYGLCVSGEMWRRDLFLKCVEDHRCSYFSIHGFPGHVLEKERDAYMSIANRIGYRFVPEEVSYPKVVRRDERVSVRSVWRNAGVAPRTRRTWLTWLLADAKGGIAWSATDPDFDFRALEPTIGGNAKPVVVESKIAFGYEAAVSPNYDFVLKWHRDNGNSAPGEVHSLLKPGDYTLCVSVGRADGTPEVALPLSGGCGRRYPIGRISVE